MVETSSQGRGRIFISYRRQETAYPAGWLFDRLAARFGPDQVFKDVDSIELGDDFVRVIEDAVGACDVLLALIGPEWLRIAGEDGRPRLEDPDDFVRLEIETALARGILVIPVLVDGAAMPQPDELPPTLAPLSHRQALELSPAHFNADTTRLLASLERTLAEVRAETPKPPERVERPRRRFRPFSKRTLALASAGVGVLVLVPLINVVFASGGDADSPNTASRVDKVVFQDRFSNRSAGWDDAGKRRNGGHYTKGAYRLYSKWNPSHWSESGFPRKTASVFPTAPRDVRIRVVARRVQGAQGVGYGLVCRAGAGSLPYYQFVIWSDKVAIEKLIPDDPFYAQLATGSPAAVRPRGTNRLQALCTTDGAGNARLTFQINGKTVASATDTGTKAGPALTTGTVGLVVANGEGSKAIEAQFDDFVVSTA